MAGDWIPISVDLPRKREVCLIAARTRWTRHEVVGRLVEWWAWIGAESADGRLAGLTVDVLASVHGFDRRFLDALLEVGWLSQDATGLTIPNFDRWFGGAAKRRVLTRRRVKNYRRNASVTLDALPENREENIENNITHPPNPPLSIREALQRKGPQWLCVEPALIEWFGHLTEEGRPPTNPPLQAKKLCDLFPTPQALQLALDTAMGHGWIMVTPEMAREPPPKLIDPYKD